MVEGVLLPRPLLAPVPNVGRPFRRPIRARQPRSATCSHLMEFGWAPLMLCIGFPGGLEPDAP
eukprot:7283301-Lingulodinium_polyedra.AAC.1